MTDYDLLLKNIKSIHVAVANKPGPVISIDFIFLPRRTNPYDRSGFYQQLQYLNHENEHIFGIHTLSYQGTNHHTWDKENMHFS